VALKVRSVKLLLLVTAESPGKNSTWMKWHSTKITARSFTDLNRLGEGSSLSKLKG
jgi:hypothetical protein